MTENSLIYPESVSREINNGNWRGAISEMIDLYNRDQGDDQLIELRNLRLKAGEQLVKLGGGHNATPCPPMCENPFPELSNDFPSIDASELNSDVLAGAIRYHGALIVRGFADQKFCERSRANIDKALKSAERFYSVRPEKREEMLATKSGQDIWFNLFSQIKGHSTSFDAFMMSRTGAVWTFLSPKVTHNLTRFFDRTGLRALLKDYFEDEPCLSLNKSVLRRVTPLENPADWHQDGAFMPSDIKSLNLWVALSECGKGTECPGMDFVPKRFENVVETGTNGAYFDWSVSHKSVSEWYKDTPTIRPYFGEGDAIFFDHFNLHATSYDESFTQTRYAIETWFFAQNHNAGNQTPAYW